MKRILDQHEENRKRIRTSTPTKWDPAFRIDNAHAFYTKDYLAPLQEEWSAEHLSRIQRTWDEHRKKSSMRPWIHAVMTALRIQAELERGRTGIEWSKTKLEGIEAKLQKAMRAKHAHPPGSAKANYCLSAPEDWHTSNLYLSDSIVATWLTYKQLTLPNMQEGETQTIRTHIAETANEELRRQLITYSSALAIRRNYAAWAGVSRALHHCREILQLIASYLAEDYAQNIAPYLEQLALN